VGEVWMVIDLFSYWFISRNLGLSKSYGTFFNIWFILQLIFFSIRVGFALHPLAGLAIFLLGLILHAILAYLI
jgi:hypothetical protein